MAKLTVYARALFALALEKDQLEDYRSQAAEALAALEEIRELSLALQSPVIPVDEKIRLLEAAFSGGGGSSASGGTSAAATADVLGCLCLLVRKGHAEELTEVLRAFLALAEEHIGLVEARVYTATALTDAQTTAIAETLSQNLQKTVTVVTTVDPGLIGGLRVNVAGQVWDGTIRMRLDRIKSQLLNATAP